MRVRGAGRVGFLALRQVIAAELAAGWPMVEVFRRHQDQLGIQVGQFRLYVKRYLGPEQRWTRSRRRCGTFGGRRKAGTAYTANPSASGLVPPGYPLDQPQGRGSDLTTLMGGRPP